MTMAFLCIHRLETEPNEYALEYVIKLNAKKILAGKYRGIHDDKRLKE